MEQVRVAADPPVADQDKAGKFQAVDILFQCRTQGQMVEGVSREGFDGDGYPAVIHKESHLDDREFAFFFADPHLTQSFFDYVSIPVRDIVIRPGDLKIEVGYIIVNDLGGTSGFFDKVRIDPADDLVLIIMDKVQGVKNIVRVALREDRFKIIPVLPDGGGFGGGIQ